MVSGSEFKFKFIIADLDESNIKNKLIPYMNELANVLLDNHCRDVTITTTVKMDWKKARVNVTFKEVEINKNMERMVHNG